MHSLLTCHEWKEAGNSIAQQQGDANVILVSWDAPLFPRFPIPITNYEQAAANTKTVGNKIADFIETNHINPQSTTLIGHSLGAQASGWAGSILRNRSASKIGNIVGLDPARPSFEDVVRTPRFFGLPGFPLGLYLSPDELDASDAERVSVIHTSKYFGIDKPISNGDNANALDIYVNGGNSGNSSEFGEFVNDAHNYAHDFLQDLLDGKGFNQDRNTEGFKNLSELNNPTNPGGEVPLVSLNTILQGNGGPQGFNRGKIDIQRSPSATLPETLNFDGTEQADNLAGTQTTNAIKGGGGDDLISGLGENDRLSGEDGTDTLFGGVGNDTLFAGNGNDLLFGGDGEDRLFGVNPQGENLGSGEIDTLTGGGAKDIFFLGNSSKDYYRTHLRSF
jgi:hypothetical protein